MPEPYFRNCLESNCNSPPPLDCALLEINEDTREQIGPDTVRKKVRASPDNTKGSVTQSMRERKGEQHRVWFPFLLPILHHCLIFIPGFAAMQSPSLLPLLVSHEPMQMSAEKPRPLAPPSPRIHGYAVDNRRS